MASSDSSGSEDSLAKEMTASLLRGKAGGGGEGGGEEEEEKESEKKDNNLVSTKTEKKKNNNNNNIATSNIPHGARRLVKRRKVVNDGKDAGAGKSGDGVRASSVSECEHPAFMFGICVHCGQRATANARDGGDEERREESGANAKTAVRYLHEGLTVSDKLLKEAKSEERMATLKQGKLFLVLDLDHTLLNSCRFDELNDEERETLDRKVEKREEEDALRSKLLGLVGGGDGGGGRRPRFPDLYCLSHFSTYTKLRPYVFEFLEEAAKICRMHVYTMGDKNYAHEMASLIDPEGKYFHGRIIGNSDSTCSRTKDLDIVLGGDDCTMIVDDTSRVWPRHARNLIRVDRYHFFRKSATSFREMEKSSVMERGLDEGEAVEEGAPAKHREVLKDVLAVLTVAHRMMAFSDDNGHREKEEHKDVREVFERNGESVDPSLLLLKGCVILPSGITPSNDERPDRHPLLLIAVGLGATIATAMEDNVTHVLARADNTEKVKWGRKRGLFIVNGNWLRECAMQNAKLDEHNFATL
jgi:RNA polymerase II C-terminal domain phosphatase-like 3/4